MSNEVSTSPSAAAQPQGAPLPPSPCVGICVMDEAHGVCSGCGRTLEDITNWPNLADKDQAAIWRTLPERLSKMGVRAFRLPATPQDIGDFLDHALRSKVGTWEMGLPGLPLQFDADTADDIRSNSDMVAANNGSGATIHLLKHDRVRAFGISDEHGNGRWVAVALVLPRKRAVMEAAVKQATVTAGIDAQVLPVDYPFARFIRTHGEDGTARFRAETRLGSVEVVAANTDIAAMESYRFDESNPDLFGIPSVFTVCAVLRCDDHDWLTNALAP